MQYYKSDVSDAFDVFIALLQEGRLDKRDGENYQKYQNENVRTVLSEVMAERANAKIFMKEEIIYLVPNLDNRFLSYSNEALKEKLNLKNNEQIYLFYFCVLVILSQFYNSEDQTLSIKQFVRVETVQAVMKKHIMEFKNYTETQLENQTIRTELDIIGIINAWETMPEFDEKAKQIGATRKNQIGFILRILRFLENEDLVWVREDNEISITEKMNALVINYYFNTQRKEKLLSMFK